MSNTEINKLNELLENEFERMARELRDACDGSYVAAEKEQAVEILGKKYNLWVVAFWESSFWFETKYDEIKGASHE